MPNSEVESCMNIWYFWNKVVALMNACYCGKRDKGNRVFSALHISREELWRKALDVRVHIHRTSCFWNYTS